MLTIILHGQVPSCARLTWNVPRLSDPPRGVGRGSLWPREQFWGGAHVVCSEGREGADIVHTLSEVG